MTDQNNNNIIII